MLVEFGGAAAPVRTDTDGNWQRLDLVGTVVITASDDAYTFEPSQHIASAGESRFSFRGTMKGCNAGSPGTKSNPCVMTRIKQLQQIQNDLRGHYRLGAHVQASATQDWNDGRGFIPIGSSSAPFRGTLDGEGHAIFNLHIVRSDENEVGLFGNVGDAGEVRNVELTGAYIRGAMYVGGLVGWNSGVIEDVSSAGNVEGHRSVGGLVGSSEGKVEFSRSTGSVTAVRYVGGLVGYGETSATIASSYSLGPVEGSDEAVGGLVGYLRPGNDVVVSNSYSHSRVEGVRSVGGLIGRAWRPSQIRFSYSRGRVVGTEDVGGLIGFSVYTSEQSPATSSYWDVHTSTQSKSAGGEGKSTEEMQFLGTYLNWDFINVWRLDQGRDYPDLRAIPR